MDRNRFPRMESADGFPGRDADPEPMDDDELFELDLGGDDEDQEDDEYGEAPSSSANDPRADFSRGAAEARALLRTK